MQTSKESRALKQELETWCADMLRAVRAGEHDPGETLTFRSASGYGGVWRIPATVYALERLQKRAKMLTPGKVGPPRVARTAKGASGYAPVAGEIGCDPYRQLPSFWDVSGARVELTAFGQTDRGLRRSGEWITDGASTFREVGDYAKRAKLRGLPEDDTLADQIDRLARKVGATAQHPEDHGVWASGTRSDVVLEAHGEVWAYNARLFADLLNMTDAQAVRVGENGEAAFYRDDRIVGLLMRPRMPDTLRECVKAEPEAILDAHYAEMAVA